MDSEIYPTLASPIRRRLDPDATLPNVVFAAEIGEHCQDDIGTYAIEDAAGHYLGRAVVHRDETGCERYFKDVFIDAFFRGKDYGRAAYVLAIEQAHVHAEPFRSDPYKLKAPGFAMWQKLIAAGVAEVVEPLRQVSQDNGRVAADRYVGHVRVPVLRNL